MTPKKSAPWCKTVIVLGVFAAGVLAGCSGKEAESAEVQHAPEAALVEVMTVAADDSAAGVHVSGLVRYKREASLSFGAPGEIETVGVDIGDRVSAGQVVAVIRRTTVGADAVESDLAEKTAEQTYERVRRLHEGGAASDSDIEAARLGLERARTRVTLTAPVAGTVLRREAERGQVVSAGQPVIVVGEAGAGVIVRAAVTATQAAAVEIGQSASVSINGRGAYSGTVARVSPVSANAAGVFEIEISVEKPGDLRSGEVADVTLSAKTDDIAPVRYIVPTLALIDARADQGVVYVVDQTGAARRRSVETGGVKEEGVIILRGLQAGDRVITRGASMLRDGDTVRVAGSVASE
ncbi:MAG: efflux RND transporter periplasmic adaptor subunit [Hyphomonadaceae bacterium]